jgi:hypothetical protein
MPLLLRYNGKRLTLLQMVAFAGAPWAAAGLQRQHAPGEANPGRDEWPDALNCADGGTNVHYYKAWYRPERDVGPVDPAHPEWVVYALDEEEATGKVLSLIGRDQPERGYKVYLDAIDDEDQGIIMFARARQTGQAVL